jgi:D-apionolactonase
VSAVLEQLRSLKAGQLTAVLDGVDLRYVRLGGLELVRRIYVSVRERDWATVDPVSSHVEADERGDSFEVRLSARHRSSEVDVSWEGSITGTADGRIGFTMAGRANRDMLYNRVGFCVLHPWRETAGRRFRGMTPAGPVEGAFPLPIGAQRFEDGIPVSLFPAVSRLELELVAGGGLVFDFEGDLFEAEDQRNWSDASFKTYCGPLAQGFPRELKRHERLAQAVLVHIEGAVDAPPEQPPRLRVGAPTGTRVPPIGVGACDEEQLRTVGPAHVRHELRLGEDWQPGLAGALALRIPVELALAVRVEEIDELPRLRDALADADVARVLVVAPGSETTPPALVREVRDALALPGVPVAGGSDRHFCELNRARPEFDSLDPVFWAVDAQVHAFDDLSVLETPEAQGEQVRTARTFAGGRQLFVSPAALRRGAPDPRAVAPLGGAWAAASAKHLAEAGADAVTYADAHPVLAEVCELQGAEVLACESSRPLEVVGLAVRRHGGTVLLAVNLTSQPLAVEADGARLKLAPYEARRIDIQDDEEER